RLLRDAMASLERSVRRIVEQEAEARFERPPSQRPEERPFALLSAEEIDEMEQSVRKLAERLKARMLRRRRSRRRGSLNVRETLRENLGTGGYPARVAFRDRRPERQNIVVLCDVSDSVRNASRLMLFFVHTLQSLFSRVRSYVFVSEVGEITRELRELDVRRAIDPQVAGKVVSLTENSSYGRALAQFVRTELGAVTRRTTVMIIGDGRNNYNPANAWALRELRLRARRLLWICPEPRASWGLGDSEMLVYERHVSQVAIVTCLGDLEKLAGSILPA
ncbi:MAG: VWA domain-containing protein, partial [Deltaproteobacteria bacterium]